MNDFKKKINRNNKSYDKMLKMILPIRKDYLKIYKSLNSKEIDVLISYKGTGYSQINEFLYDNTISNLFPLLHSYNLNIKYLNDMIDEKYNSLVDHITVLDNIFKKFRLKKKIKVFRGINGNILKKLNKLKINDEITMNSYSSTSFNPIVAYKFTTDKIYKKTKINKSKCLIEITVPKNTNIIYLQWNLKNKNKKEYFIDSEFEILLERGCVLKLDKISTIEHRFFTLNHMNWEKYLNTKNKVKKIKIYHMSIIKIEKKEIPNKNNINNNLDWNKIITPFLIKNLCYIPSKKSNFIKNNYID